jgi:hypothetical protein
MKASKVRLVLALLLFGFWTAWLVYLTITTTRPIVLSRPQFLVSQLDIIASLEKSGQREVAVKEVCWPPQDHGLVGKTLSLESMSEAEGFSTPGDYILPLTRDGEEYKITPLPRSPGFGGSSRPRIYRLTAQTRWQLDQIRKPAQ